MRLLLVIFTIKVTLVFGEKASKKDLSNGFRNEIDWVEWDNAIEVATNLNKPIFFLIHKTWCGACKGLKQEFSSSPKMSDLISLSKKFVMVNVQDDDEPEDEKYAPDGGYIPRILFLDIDGEPLKTNNEARYKNNKYFYPLIPQVIDGMERALTEFEAIQETVGTENEGDEDEEDENEGKDALKREINEEDIHSKSEDKDERQEREAGMESKKENERKIEKSKEDIAGKDGKKVVDTEKEDKDDEMKNKEAKKKQGKKDDKKEEL